MNYDYLAKIRGSISIYTKRKTSNVLEGGFSSVFRGRSLEFDDLKEYDFGDNVHDIDWKSSSRTGKTLIRRYVAEKKHNMLFVGDTGIKMSGDTDRNESKVDMAMMIFGTIAYLADRQGADINLACATPQGPRFRYFRSGQDYLEELLQDYQKNILQDIPQSVAEVLGAVSDQIPRRMIIVLITDLAGLTQLDDRLLKKVTYRNDMLAVQIEDAWYTGEGGFDLGSGKYIDLFFRKNRRLAEIEKRERSRLETIARERFKKYRVPMIKLSSQEQILDGVIELLNKYRSGTGG